MAAAVLSTRSERFAEGNCHKRGRKKTVTWPMDEELCEVRHFLMDDAPSFLGVAVQSFLHCKQQSIPLAHNISSYKESSVGCHPSEAKRSRFTSVIKPNGNFSGLSMAKRSSVPEVELETSMAIAAPWHRPYKFILDDSWLWAGGDESTEVALQQHREMRFFESFYPRWASIPDSPAEPLERCKQVDDSLLSKIPLIPLEEQVPLIPLEEELSQDVEPEKMSGNNQTDSFMPEREEMTDPLELGTDMLKHGNHILSSNPMAESVKVNPSNLMSEADSSIAAVAAAACMVVKSLGESDLVDEKLLLEILKNPSLLKSLTCSNQVIKNKSLVKNNDTASRIPQEPITSLLGKLPPDHGACLNASPVSVLARWEEGANTGRPFGTTPIASGSANVLPTAIANVNPVTNNPPATSLPSQASYKTTHIGSNFWQKRFEIATQAVPETCMSSPSNPLNLQESSQVHACKPKDEVRPPCQNGLRSNTLSASCSMQSIPTVAPSVSPSSVLSTSLTNSELPWRTPLLGEIKDAESKMSQAKRTAHGAPLNTRGGGRAKRFCMYFNSPRGCRNGGSCAFVHQSLDSELNTMAL